jgi:hypothetical protein
MSLITIVKGHAAANLTTVDEDDGPFLNVVVRRRHILNDALRNLRCQGEKKLLLPIRIRFVGESGVDAGGLRREFASLLQDAFSQCSMLDGPSGRKSFSHDSALLGSGEYRLAGRLFALTVLQGGSGPKCFCLPVAKYICQGKAAAASVDDIPSVECRQALEKVNKLLSTSSHAFSKLSDVSFCW